MNQHPLAKWQAATLSWAQDGLTLLPEHPIGHGDTQGTWCAADPRVMNPGQKFAFAASFAKPRFFYLIAGKPLEVIFGPVRSRPGRWQPLLSDDHVRFRNWAWHLA